MTSTNANNFLLKIIIIVMCMLLAAVGMLGFLTYMLSRQQQPVQAQNQFDGGSLGTSTDFDEDDETIYENIFIDGIHVGGLTKIEAAAKLEEELQKPLESNNIAIIYETSEYKHPFSDFGVKYNINEKVTEAYNYARSGSLHERSALIMKLKSTPLKLSLDYTYNDNSIVDNLLTIAGEIEIEPVDAVMERANGQFVITDGQEGLTLDISETGKKVSEVLLTKASGTVTAIVTAVEPTITSADLANAQTLLGTYRTKFTAGQVGRNTNIETASGKINNVRLMPGEVFSTNYHFGPTTYDNGYRMANIIENGRFTEGMGGGVCQVSSTLYMAVLYAELDVVERRNHSLKVSYLDYGFDATLAGDYIDFKFKNSTQYPLIVESYIENTTLTVNIYGHESRSPNRKLEFSNKLIQTNPPSDEIVIEDPNLPLGQRQVVTAAKNGYRYEVYKHVYEGEQLLETVLVNTSTYRSVQGEVRVGTGPEATDVHDETEAANGGEAEILDGEDIVDVVDTMPPAAETDSPTVEVSSSETESSEPAEVEEEIKTEEPLMPDVPVMP